MLEARSRQPDDWRERQAAVDITRSCIVQAPAGSGKTELLVQRLLALLSVADAPEEVLSITFTRKAAGEMKMRLLQALERACDDAPPVQNHDLETWQRARAVLNRDREKGWGLLDNPARLQLTTIDSFCSLITRRMPWLSRFGEQPKVTDDPSELYRAASESLLSRVERGGGGQDAVESLLVHLDNRLPLLRELLVAMLGRRDQWLRHLMTNDAQASRQLLESSLQRYVTACLSQLCLVFGPERCEEISTLLHFAASNLDQEHCFALAVSDSVNFESLEFWVAAASLLLTSAGSLRKSVTKSIGFPADKSAQVREMKLRAVALLGELRGDPAVEPLQAVRRLPATVYEQKQWQILHSLVELLPLAVVELKEVFRSQGQVDFVEVSGSAKAALGSVTEPEELLLQLDGQIRHLLVDEFQDTSFAQYDLLCRLTAGWEAGDGRTLFLVGDPMQSIYRFREAEVGLYLRVCKNGFNDLPVDRIVLNTNFRSQGRLVDWVNAKFAGLFPANEDETRGAVRFSPAHSFNGSDHNPIITMHGYSDRQDNSEATRVVELIQASQKENPDGSIAVLVRSRGHLAAIVSALKSSHLSYQAQDVDPLVDRPVIQDLLSLTRALHHHADRVAWLSLLRAPWCGLSLDDLTRLCAKEPHSTLWQLLTRPSGQIEMFEQVSSDGRQRLARILPVIKRALQSRGRLSIRRLVESTWLSLNGPACVDASDLVDADQFFTLLEDLEVEGSLTVLEERLGKLYAAPDPKAGPSLQLMTIHKAKGLEFDTVILPGLGRGVRSQERALLRWLEHPDFGLLLAPIPPIASEFAEPTYSAIGQILQEKDDFEALRLLYVAVTRAKSQLHLLGHAKRNSDDELVPHSRSLLAVLWPSCADDFTRGACTEESACKVTPLASTIRRLPLNWFPPILASRIDVRQELSRRASSDGHYTSVDMPSRLTEEGRVVGVVVHAWLERIASDGLESWGVNVLEGQLENFKVQLSAQGIPLSRLDACAQNVLSCLLNSVGSSRGRWLLGPREHAFCELSLNGVVEGQLVRATIDRIFLDEDGMRWVVDYKTSRPEEGEDTERFLCRELERYNSQLKLYKTLIEGIHPENQVRTALYFPCFDGWAEVET